MGYPFQISYKEANRIWNLENGSVRFLAYYIRDAFSSHSLTGITLRTCQKFVKKIIARIGWGNSHHAEIRSVLLDYTVNDHLMRSDLKAIMLRIN